MSYSQGYGIGATGRVAVVDVSAPVLPVAHRGGFTFDAGGSLVTVINATAPASFANGFPFSAAGALQIVLLIAAPPSSFKRASFGFGTGATQALQCTDTLPIASYSNGLPFSAEGLLCVEYSGVVPLGRPFPSGSPTALSSPQQRESAREQNGSDIHGPASERRAPVRQVLHGGAAKRRKNA